MGYKMRIIKRDFFIASDKQDAAMKALKEQIANDKIHSLIGKEATMQVRNFVPLMFDLGYDIWWDKITGDCNYIRFIGDKLGDDKQIFITLAPFLRDGSYVEFLGEDEARWRWCSINGKFVEKKAKIIWE